MTVAYFEPGAAVETPQGKGHIVRPFGACQHCHGAQVNYVCDVGRAWIIICGGFIARDDIGEPLSPSGLFASDLALSLYQAEARHEDVDTKSRLLILAELLGQAIGRNFGPANTAKAVEGVTEVMSAAAAAAAMRAAATVTAEGQA